MAPEAVLEEPEQEVEEEILDEEQEETQTRTRRILSKENVYVYPVKDKDDEKACNEARGAKDTLVYKQTEDDDEPVKVEGFRVFKVIKDAEYDDDGELVSGEVVAAVLARTADMASRFFLEHKNYDLDMAFKTKRRGRAPSKVEELNRRYGIILEKELFKGGKEANGLKDNADKDQLKDWNKWFSKPNGVCAHYRNEDGSWKDVT